MAPRSTKLNNSAGHRGIQAGVNLKPDSPETHNNLGTVYFRTQRYADAAASFKTAVRLRPGYGEAHFDLAVAYVALKDRKGALDEYNVLKP